MRFRLTRCEYQSSKENKDQIYEGPVVVLTKDPGLAVYFPILEHTARLLKYIFEVHNNEDYEELEEDEEEYEFSDADKITYVQTISIYQTMVNLWRDSNLFLSGLVMDSSYSNNAEEDILVVYMVLSDDESGFVSSVVRINFQHALVLSSLLGMEINLNEVLLYKLIPSLFNDDDDDDDDDVSKPKHMPSLLTPEENDSFPVDSKLVDIARNLLKNEDHKKGRKGKKKPEDDK